MIFRTNFLGTLIGIAIAVVGLTACDNEERLLDPGSGIVVNHNLEIHFVKDGCEKMIDCLPHESEPCRMESGLTFFRSSDIHFHECDRGESSTRSSHALLIVDASDNQGYLHFGALSDSDELTFRHYFHSPTLFDYKRDMRAVMTSHWKRTEGTHAECTGVIFDGREYPVMASRYHSGTYEVTIALPDGVD